MTTPAERTLQAWACQPIANERVETRQFEQTRGGRRVREFTDEATRTTAPRSAGDVMRSLTR